MAKKRKILYAAGAAALLAVLFMWHIYSNARTEVLRESGTESHLIFSALDQFYLDTGRYPTQEEGLELLLPEYIRDRDSIVDAWGNPYIYEIDVYSNGLTVVRLATYGADGVSGGEGENTDIAYVYDFPPKGTE